MKSVEYWKRRAEARMYEELEKAEDTAGMIAKVYAKAARYLMDKADAVFERYQTLEKMTEAQALEMIRSLSKYDDVDEVIRVLEADHSEEAQFLVKRMKNTSAYEFRIKRLGEMLRQVNGLMTSVYGQEMKEVEGVLSEIASDGYLKTMYDIQQRINVGFSVAHIDKKRIAKILNTNWSGMHFSERIWNNTQKLGQTVKEQILLGALTGKTEREMADVIAQEFGKGAGVARRLVRTESCHVASEANAEAYEDAGIEMYLYLATLDLRTSAVCRELDGKRFKVSERQTGANCPPMHPWCRSTTIAIVDEEYLKTMQRTYRDPETGRNGKVPLTMSYDEWYRKYVLNEPDPVQFDRSPVDIQFDKTVEGVKKLEGFSLNETKDVSGRPAFNVTLKKRNTTEWDELPSHAKKQLARTREGKSYMLDKGEYHVRRYADGSEENAARDRIADAMGAKYIGFADSFKYNRLTFADFYQKGEDIFYSIGEADIKRTISDDAVEKIKEIASDRDSFILDALKKDEVSAIKQRSGDEWVSSMKKFHKTIQADDLPTILTEKKYDEVNTPVLFRGISPKSRLRKDITSTMTTEEMAKQFFTSSDLFPSRGVYGDGVAYCSPSYKKIAMHYATNGGANPHGGVIIEFKLKENANIIEYEDARMLFQKLSSGKGLIFNKKQENAINKEVGKAMNALGYDAIIKHNGDGTGKDFYIILNRGAIVTKENYITTKL